MISIKTQTGHWLNTEDSKLYIQFELRSRFFTYAEFYNELWIFENPLYWGDFILEESKKDYKVWIMEIAKEIFDK